MVVDIFGLVVGGGEFILGSGVWWCVYFGWWCMVVGIFCVVVRGGRFILGGGG